MACSEALCVDTGRPEKQVKVFFEPMRHRIEASGAGHFEVALVAGAQTDVLDLIVGPAVFGDEVGAAAHRHSVELPNPGAVIDGAGRDGLIEFKWLPFEIEHRNQYGHSTFTVTVLWQEWLERRSCHPGKLRLPAQKR